MGRMSTISMDLRARILAAYDRGDATCPQVGETLCSSGYGYRWGGALIQAAAAVPGQGRGSSRPKAGDRVLAESVDGADLAYIKTSSPTSPKNELKPFLTCRRPCANISRQKPETEVNRRTLTPPPAIPSPRPQPYPPNLI